MKGPVTTILIVDDNSVLRAALERMLRDWGYDVRSYGSAEELLNAGARPPVGCLVLEFDLPGLDGLELQQKIRGDNAPLPMVFVSGIGDIPTAVQAMKNGAIDFLPKPIAQAALRRAVKSGVEQSRKAHTERVQLTELQNKFSVLTARETEVLRLLVAGLLNREVAAELGIAVKTAKVHRGRLMKKLGVRSMIELACLAEKAGIFRTSSHLAPPTRKQPLARTVNTF